MKKENKIMSRDKVVKTYYVYCPKCDQEIKGNSESHVKVNLRFHLDKHKYSQLKEVKKHGDKKSH